MRHGVIMAYGRKTGGRNFEKGHKLAKGTPKLSDEQRLLRKALNELHGKLLIVKYCIKSHAELKQFIKNPNATCLELMIARMIERAISKAEVQYLNWIYERLGWDFDEENYRRKSQIENELIREVSDLGFIDEK